MSLLAAVKLDLESDGSDCFDIVMKNGVYISPGSKTYYSGVEKKIKAQIGVLENFFNVKWVVLEKNQVCKFRSLLWRLPFGSWERLYDNALEEIRVFDESNKVSFFYIRGQALDRGYICFLRKLRMFYPETKIVFEIPTYPYDLELFQSLTMWPWYFKDHFYRRYLKQYIDRILVYSKDDTIFGVPTICTINGLDTNVNQ